MILSIGFLGTNCSEISTLIQIHTSSFRKIHLKMSSGKWRLFCLGFNVLIDWVPVAHTYISGLGYHWWCGKSVHVKTLRLRQNGRHFVDDILKCIFLNENVWLSIKISLKFVPMSPINNIPTLIQIMAWCWSGNKTLSEPMVVSLLTHKCVTRPQWVNIKTHMSFGDDSKPSRDMMD